MQETFLKVWKNRRTIDIRISFRNFLLTSVRNSCTDYLRKESVTARYTDQIELPHTSMSPEDFYTLGELETRLRQALEKLSSDVREVFEMNRFNGLTYREIATRLELSPKTIEARMSKALKRDYPEALYGSSGFPVRPRLRERGQGHPRHSHIGLLRLVHRRIVPP